VEQFHSMVFSKLIACTGVSDDVAMETAAVHTRRIGSVSGFELGAKCPRISTSPGEITYESTCPFWPQLPLSPPCAFGTP
jgi:hypothetical protein